MCFELGDPAAMEILKNHMYVLVIVMFLYVQAVMWYKVYLGKKQGYKKKYSFWVNAFHPFKNNKPSLTTRQTWLFKLTTIVFFACPAVYMVSLHMRLYCEL